MKDYHLISSDSHVNIPDDAWQQYLDPEFRDRAPRVERTDEGDFRVFEGKRTPIIFGEPMAWVAQKTLQHRIVDLGHDMVVEQGLIAAIEDRVW